MEVDVGSGPMGDCNVVGLPDLAVKESREPIKSALKNYGFDSPNPHSVTISLAPAGIPNVIVPQANAREAAVVDRIEVYAIRCLKPSIW